MLVAQLGGLAQADTVNDRGMIELVADDGVVGGEECLEDSSIRIKARRVENSILFAVKLRDFALKLLVDVLNVCLAEKLTNAIIQFVNREDF